LWGETIGNLPENLRFRDVSNKAHRYRVNNGCRSQAEAAFGALASFRRLERMTASHELGHYQIVTRRLAEFSAQKAAREAQKNDDAIILSIKAQAFLMTGMMIK
jgi:hypothetical protein